MLCIKTSAIATSSVPAQSALLHGVKTTSYAKNATAAGVNDAAFVLDVT
jgi:hypothetical protein